jgi:hypothetical protein
LGIGPLSLWERVRGRAVGEWLCHHEELPQEAILSASTHSDPWYSDRLRINNHRNRHIRARAPPRGHVADQEVELAELSVDELHHRVTSSGSPTLALTAAAQAADPIGRFARGDLRGDALSDHVCAGPGQPDRARMPNLLEKAGSILNFPPTIKTLKPCEIDGQNVLDDQCTFG